MALMPLNPLAGRRRPPQIDEDEDEQGSSDNGGSMAASDDEEYVELENGDLLIRPKQSETSPDHNPFYENLAEKFDESYMETHAVELLKRIEQDKTARKKRDEQQADGIKRTGLGNDAPGGANFSGASRTVHPGLLSVNLDFAARTIKELFPSDGPVKTHIRGKQTPDKEERAARKSEHMNFQFTKEIKEYRAELEQLLTQVPMGGSQYMKFWWDSHLQRICCEFVPIDDVLLPYHASSFYMAKRRTHVLKLDEIEFSSRVATGMYRDVDTYTPPQLPEGTKSEVATQKVEGKEAPGQNDDGIRLVYEVQVILECDEDNKAEKERACPYIISLDERTGKVLAWYRNWEEADEHFEPMDWMAEFPFIPWRGAYAIGLPHMMGGLSAAQTGAVRAVLDSAFINTVPTAVMKKGARVSGQSASIDPTGVTEIDSGMGVDDIRAAIMPLPFNPPSEVLINLLGYLDQQMGNLVRTSLDMTANDTNANTPVGTQLSRVEQGLIVFSSIFARLHSAQQKCFEIVHRLNRMYMPDVVKFNNENIIRREDYDSDVDVQPVSDPHIFSELQRYAQLQEIQVLNMAMPGHLDTREFWKKALTQLKVEDPEGWLIKIPEPKEQNAILENVQLMAGTPVTAFPLQDHLAHLNTHLEFYMSPVFGQIPAVAAKMIGPMMQHVIQHLGLWYVQDVYHTAKVHMNGLDPGDMLAVDDPTVKAKMDKLLAVAAQHSHLNAQQALGKIPPIIQQAMQLLKQYTPPQPMDPTQAAMADTQRQAQADQMQNQIQQAELAQKAQADQRKDQLTAAQIQARAAESAAKDQTALQKQSMGDATQVQTNTADNQTAMTISAFEAEHDRQTQIRTGTGINPGGAKQ